MSDEEQPLLADIGYAEAMAELESILAEIEGEDVDVDRLAERVIRAAELVRLCRHRIVETTMQVERVVQELQEGSEADSQGDAE